MPCVAELVSLTVPGEQHRTWTVLGAEHLPIGPVEEFLEYHRLDAASPHTVRGYAQGLRQYWTLLELTGADWRQVDVALFGGFRRWLATGLLPGVVSLSTPPPVRAASTVENRSAAVLSFYRFHYDMNDEPAALRLYRPAGRVPHRGGYRETLGHLRRGAGGGLRPVFRSRRAVSRPQPLFTPEQVQALLDGCATHTGSGWEGSLRDRLLFATLHETGVRLGECLSLQHQDWVIGAGSTPYLELTPREDHPHCARVKGSEPRRIYISHDLESLYSEYLWELCDRGAVEACEPLDQWWVFVNVARGDAFTAMRPETVYSKVRTLKKKLGAAVPEAWTPHWFRHSHATWLLLAGVAEHIVMRRLGHRDVQTTLGMYGWVTEDAELRALADWQSLAPARAARAHTEGGHDHL